MATYKQQINAYLKRMRSSYSLGTGDLGEVDYSALNAENQLSIKNTKLINDIDKKTEKNFWQKFTDAWDTITSNIGKGVLNWADSLGDLVMGGIGAVASWAGNTELEQNMKTAINYDWQTTVNEYLKKVDATRLLNPRTYTKEYWTSTWTPDDIKNEFNSRKYNNFVSQKTADVLAQVGEGIGEFVPDVILAIFTGGGSVAAKAGTTAAKAGTTAASVASKTSKAAKVAKIALKTAQGMGKGFATVAREDGSLGTGAGYAAIQGAISGATTYLATEKLGIGSLANKWQAKGATKLVETLASKGAKELTQNIVGYGVTALTDFGFNFATSMIRGALDPVFKNITYNPNAIHEAYGDKERATATLKQLALSSVISATTSTVTGALRTLLIKSQRVDYSKAEDRQKLIYSTLTKKEMKRIANIQKRIDASKEAKEQIQKATSEAQEKINAESIKLDNVTRFVEKTIERANELGNVPKEAMENLMDIYSDYVEDHTNKQIDYTNDLFKKLAEFEIETETVYRVDDDLKQASLAAEVYNPYKSIRANIESADHPSHYRHIEVDGIKVNGRIDQDNILNLKTTKNNIALSAEQTQSILYLMGTTKEKIIAKTNYEDFGIFGNKYAKGTIEIDNTILDSDDTSLISDLISGAFHSTLLFDKTNKDKSYIAYFDDNGESVGHVTIIDGKVNEVSSDSEQTQKLFSSNQLVTNKPSDDKLSVGEKHAKEITADLIKQTGNKYISQKVSRTIVKDILKDSFNESIESNKAFQDSLNNYIDNPSDKDLKAQVLENYDKIVLTNKDKADTNIKDIFANDEEYNLAKNKLSDLLNDIENNIGEIKKMELNISNDIKELPSRIKGFNDLIDRFTASYSMDNAEDIENSLQRLAEDTLNLKTKDGTLLKDTIKNVDEWTTDFKNKIRSAYDLNSKLAEKGELSFNIDKLELQVRKLQGTLEKTRRNFYTANNNLKSVERFKKFKADIEQSVNQPENSKKSELGSMLYDMSFAGYPINKHGQFKLEFTTKLRDRLKGFSPDYIEENFDDSFEATVAALDEIIDKGNTYLSIDDSAVVALTLDYMRTTYNRILAGDISKFRDAGQDTFNYMDAISRTINKKPSLLKALVNDAIGARSRLERVFGRGVAYKLLYETPKSNLDNQTAIEYHLLREWNGIKDEYSIKNKIFSGKPIEVVNGSGQVTKLTRDEAWDFYADSLSSNIEKMYTDGYEINNRDIDVDDTFLINLKHELKVTDEQTAFITRVMEKLINTDIKKLLSDYSIKHFGYDITLDENYLPRKVSVNRVSTEEINPIASFGSSHLKARVENHHRMQVMGFTKRIESYIKDASQILSMDDIRGLSRIMNIKYDTLDGNKKSIYDLGLQIFSGNSTSDSKAITNDNGFFKDYMDRVFLKSSFKTDKSSFLANATSTPITFNLGTYAKQMLDPLRMVKDVGVKNFLKGAFRGTSMIFNRNAAKKTQDVLTGGLNTDNIGSATYLKTQKENTVVAQNTLRYKHNAFLDWLSKPLNAINRFSIKYVAFPNMQVLAEQEGYGKIGDAINYERAVELLDARSSLYFSNTDPLDMSPIRYGERGTLTKYLVGTYQGDAQKKLESVDESVFGNSRSKKREQALKNQLATVDEMEKELNNKKAELSNDDSAKATREIANIEEKLKSYNRIKNQFAIEISSEQEYRKHTFRRVGLTISTLASTAIIEAVIDQLNSIAKGKKSIKDKENIEEVIQDAGYNFTLSWMPYINIISNAFINNQKQPNLVQLQGLQKILETTLSTKEYVTSDKKSKYGIIKPVRKALSAVGYYSGLPLDNLIGYIEGGFKNIASASGNALGYEIHTLMEGYNSQYLEKETKKYLELGEVNRAIASNRANMAFFKTGNVDYKLAKELTVKEVRIRPQPLGEYNNRQIEIFNSYYTKANQQASRMLTSRAYLKADDELKAKLLTNLYKAYYEYALYIIDQEKEPSSKIAKLLVKKATKGTLTAEERLYLQSVGVL